MHVNFNFSDFIVQNQPAGKMLGFKKYAEMKHLILHIQQ